MEEVVRFIKNRKREVDDCVMFDIDDTLINSETKESIRHIKELLDTCISYGYIIVIITARHGDKDTMKYTKLELLRHSIFYDFIGFYPPQEKTLCKQYLTRTRGWNFVLSVGDQPTDLTDSDMYLLVV